MALPLLMMAGAGILGGGQYLLKKMDDRRSESLLGDLEAKVQASGAAGTTLGDMYMSAGERLASGNTLLQRNSGEIEDLLGGFDMAMLQQEQQQAAQLAQMQDAYSQTNMGIARDLQTRYNSEMSEFAETQTQFRAAMNALDNPSNLNSVTTLYNLFNILEPGGRVTQNEDGTFTGIGSGGNRVSGWLNDMQGKGLTDATIKEITDSIWQQYAPRLERAREVKKWYDGEMQAIGGAGRNVRSPVGSLGINWDLNQYPPDMGQPNDVPDGYSLPEGG